MGGFANNAPIVTDGLVFYVDAGNSKSYPGSGTTWSDLVGGNDGTLTNGPTYDSGNGGSVTLDGSNDRVIYPFNESLNPQPTDAFSVFVWFKDLDSSAGAILSNMNVSTNYSGWDLWRQSSGKLAVHIISSWSSNAFKITINQNASLGTYDGSCPTTNSDAVNSIDFYKNGLIHTSGKQHVGGGNFSSSSETTNYGTQVFEIGSRNGSQICGSTISNVSFYNRALSASEVLQNYNALKNRFV
jgi:hypothetical protein